MRQRELADAESRAGALAVDAGGSVLLFVGFLLFLTILPRSDAGS